MASETLKACPLCGSAEFPPSVVDSSRGWSVHCVQCGCGTDWRVTKHEAVFAWNRRSLPSREEIEKAIRAGQNAGPYNVAPSLRAADAVLRLMGGGDE